jgi:predicted nucleotidyltransferase
MWIVHWRRIFSKKTIAAWVLLLLSWTYQLVGFWGNVDFLTQKLGQSGGQHTVGIISSRWFFLFLNIAGFGWLFLTLRGSEQSPTSLRKSAMDEMIPLEDIELHDQASRWLSGWLSSEDLRVQRAVLFGSVVHEHYPTSDVDVIVLSKPITGRTAKSVGRRIKSEMRREFKLRFGHPLHVQLFLAGEKERFDAFLSRLDKYEELPLRGG